MNGISNTPIALTASGPPPRNEQLWGLAQSMEANFLAEMLKTAGLGEAQDALGGGVGEDQFSSFLVQEYATATVKAGGLGLAETIYRSLVQGQEGQA